MAIRRGSISSVSQSSKKIQFVQNYNHNASPFMWDRHR